MKIKAACEMLDLSENVVEAIFRDNTARIPGI